MEETRVEGPRECRSAWGHPPRTARQVARNLCAKNAKMPSRNSGVLKLKALSQFGLLPLKRRHELKGQEFEPIGRMGKHKVTKRKCRTMMPKNVAELLEQSAVEMARLTRKVGRQSPQRLTALTYRPRLRRSVGDWRREPQRGRNCKSNFEATCRWRIRTEEPPS